MKRRILPTFAFALPGACVVAIIVLVFQALVEFRYRPNFSGWRRRDLSNRRVSAFSLMIGSPGCRRQQCGSVFVAISLAMMWIVSTGKRIVKIA